ncbi:hypothetical protein SCP_0505630 [Sparassis crispa]|uniref:Uncharacterized protein n=1 Tax=Sparassis crispa TaxID=139825 RepID=A0A401GMU3_9APHY|nr:hypothetical protein SCP_0505630 [Sparassis crispa]GBE83512.1 hypothetical protein SCP_0505630 [Sparassis crispa]
MPQSPSSPLVLMPMPAHRKSSSQKLGQDSRGGSRKHISMQSLVPTSRRASQQQVREREREGECNAGLSLHPYAMVPSPGGYCAMA